MPDGIEIAINVRLPDGYVAGKKYPTLFEMSGYDGGSAEGGTLLNDFGLNGLPVLPASDSRQLTDRFNERVRHDPRVGARHRLLRRRVRPLQPRRAPRTASTSSTSGSRTSRGRTATSRSSVTRTAASPASASPRRSRRTCAPRRCRASSTTCTAASRTPAASRTTASRSRGPARCGPAYDLLGGARARASSARRATTTSRTGACAARTTSSTKRRTILDDPLVQGLTDTDTEWFRARSLITNVDQINVPIHITGAYQDEQTGPRGPTHLWEQVQGVPKRLVLTNGDHNTQNPAYAGPEVWGDRKAWIDHFMGVQRDARLRHRRARTRRR